MRTKIMIVLLAFLSYFLGMQAQDKTQNYVRVRTMLNAANTSYVDNINYYDGIGRPLQTVEMATKSGTQTGSILATLQEYDDAGRETNSWLPTPITGTYLAATSFKTRAQGASGYSDANPYNQVNYEASPLNRVSSQYGAGAAWHTNSKAVKTEYLLNQASGVQACKYYYLSNNALAGGSAYYAANTLKVTKVTDEDGKVNYSFVDKIGRKLLERQVVGTTYLDTYYIYDDLGNIRYVLQPMYQTEASLAKYAFQYEYDGYNRCVKKTLPGTEPIIYVYDNTTNQLLYSQDGNQRAVSTTVSAQKWTYYKYDAFYRITEQGECTGQNNASNTVVHLKNYYDDYSFIGSGNFTNSAYTAGSAYYKGRQTGTEVTVLGSSSKICTVFHYDGRGREIKRMQNNLLGGYETTQTTYTHTDKPSVVTHTHTASGKTTRTEVTTYSYDEKDRVATVTHKLGTNTAVTLVSYTYDSFGRMQSKKLHGSATNQLTYSYNIRNWLTNTTSSKFTQNLTYNSGTSGYFNGNIQSMSWTANGASHSYSFTYDGANRMLNATHNNNYYTEKVTAYDRNGNIKGLQRYGQTGASAYGLLDNLTYTLNGNQLTKVEDATTATSYSGGTNFVNGSTATTEYTYDANGNLTKDLNKNITNISYNCLNLPQVITFTDGSTITYTYAADGTKLRTVHVISGTTTQTDYCGNVIYESGAQKYLLNEVGYYNLSSSGYFYYLKDHQGNNRVVINSSGTVQETNHYYPFGGLFASTSVQPFKYNGKGFDNKKGLNWYDYGARHYDATLGRFTTVDPLADKMPTWSPYTYCYNNPVRLIDENGLFPGPGDLFKTKQEAAKDWGMYYNGASIMQKTEKASVIYEVQNKGDVRYSYTKAVDLGAHNGKMKLVSEGKNIATIHSHGNYDGKIVDNKGNVSLVKDNEFSSTDKANNEKYNLTGYLATPNGSLLEHDPSTGNIKTISTNMPSDPKDPSRLNKIDPVDNSQSFSFQILEFVRNLFK